MTSRSEALGDPSAEAVARELLQDIGEPWCLGVHPVFRSCAHCVQSIRTDAIRKLTDALTRARNAGRVEGLLEAEAVCKVVCKQSDEFGMAQSARKVTKLIRALIAEVEGS